MKNSNLNKHKSLNLFEKFTQLCVTLMQKYLPDAFLFAAVLTFIVFIATTFMTKQTPFAVAMHWGNGVWSLLSFSMQMVMVLVTGHTLATAPFFKKILNRLSDLPKSPIQAIMYVTFVSGVACILNWGFGLVIGAIYAKEIAKKVQGVDYRLLIASAYSGFLLWHGGISGSIPLTLASGNLSKATAGALNDGISTTQTIFSSYNLIILFTLLFTLPLLNAAMHPKNKEDIFQVDPALLEDEVKPIVLDRAKMTPADKIENSPIVNIAIGILGYTYIIGYFFKNGFDLNLNIVNMIFLITAILAHKTPKNLLLAFSSACKGASGIILQFPFYAGIMGMMIGKNIDGSSLAGIISQSFISSSTTLSFPSLTFLSAGIVNFFVPSGGGQWAVQAPIMMPASLELGVSAAKTGMAIAWGDAWTNMIQPFWALPALGIAKLGAKDIMGYGVIITIYSGIIITLGLTFL
ncbi:short-chain fatty acid transporter [uncultured Cetobacterium sp.]|uniref:short-chain fatty acid transporter n=1 Tax=uncultured Cetobacterium sp. TaxID=527638 RepID=UPI00260931A0|nr:short-chain fatty acid transporter [uncultured Cetobacterium sp.]